MISMMKPSRHGEPITRPSRREASCTEASAEVAPVEVLEAFVLLADDSHLSGWYDRFTIKLVDGDLVIDGRLPSFFLKQVLQERLRSLGLGIVNRVKVAPR